MATSLSDNLSDEIINIKCCFCAEDNRTREADKYCIECKDYYCTPCTETHRKFPGTKGHKLLDKSDFRSLGPDGSLPGFPTERCSLHPTKIVDVFCEDHNEVACASCMILTHRSCKNIHIIPEAIDRLYNPTELTQAKQNIFITKTAMEEVKKAKEIMLKELKESYDEEVESVTAFRQELDALLDDMEQQTIQELTREYERIESSLTDELSAVNILIDAMNELSSQLRKSEGNRAQEFISVKTSVKMGSKAEDVKKELERKTNETVCFVADQNIKIVMQQIQVLGKVSCFTQNTLYKVKSQREIDVKKLAGYKDERWTNNCFILGICMTSAGTLLVADHGNKKLYDLDINSGTITDYIKLQEDPFDVCLVNKTEAVTSLRNNTVQFVSLGNKMTATRTLVMKHKCWGLAHSDGKLFISDCGKNVYIHDLIGRELRKVSTDASGKEIFQKALHITFSNAGDRVFVADKNNDLVILDPKGNYLSTVTDTALSGTKAVCTDGRNIFACCFNSNNVIQIGPENKLLGEIGKFEQPLTVCFDSHKTRLIITQLLDSHRNKITILDLE